MLASRLQPGTVAVHLAWALLEGVSPEAIAHTLLLTGMYSGIDAYTLGIRTLHKVATLLAELAAAGRTDTTSIMQALVQLFPA